MQLGQRCQEKNLERENQPRDSHAPLSRVHAQPLRSRETSKWVTSQWHGVEWVFLTAANCWCRKTGLAKESLKPGRLCPGPSSGIHRAKRRSGIFPSHLLFPPKSEDIALFSLSFMSIRSHVHSQPWVSVGLFRWLGEQQSRWQEHSNFSTAAISFRVTSHHHFQSRGFAAFHFPFLLLGQRYFNRCSASDFTNILKPILVHVQRYTHP